MRLSLIPIAIVEFLFVAMDKSDMKTTNQEVTNRDVASPVRSNPVCYSEPCSVQPHLILMNGPNQSRIQYESNFMFTQPDPLAFDPIC